MKRGESASIMDSFEALEDPRIDRCKRHQMLDIIVIAICATICGADSWVHMEMFGKNKEEWLKTFLEPGLPTNTVFQATAAGGLRGTPRGWCSPSDMGTSW